MVGKGEERRGGTVLEDNRAGSFSQKPVSPFSKITHQSDLQERAQALGNLDTCFP